MPGGKHKRRKSQTGIRPEDVMARVLSPMPYAKLASVGRAEEVVSKDRNTEKMHQFYTDNLDLRGGDASSMVSGSSGFSRTSRSKWSSFSRMPLWGSVQHFSPTCNSESHRRDRVSRSRSVATVSSQSSLSELSFSASCRSLDLARKIDGREGREPNTRSFDMDDPTNLSRSMRKSMRRQGRRRGGEGGGAGQGGGGGGGDLFKRAMSSPAYAALSPPWRGGVSPKPSPGRAQPAGAKDHVTSQRPAAGLPPSIPQGSLPQGSLPPQSSLPQGWNNLGSWASPATSARRTREDAGYSTPGRPAHKPPAPAPATGHAAGYRSASKSPQPQRPGGGGDMTPLGRTESAFSMMSGVSQSASVLGSSRKLDQALVKTMKASSPLLQKQLYAEFFYMKDTLEAEGGVQVGFGGLAMLAEHVVKGKVDCDTVLCIEVEFCTHGYDLASAEEAALNPLYGEYMRLCDAVEGALYPQWNLCFVIKDGRARLGAFEVCLLWTVGSVEFNVTLHSKLQARRLPSPSSLANRLSVALNGDPETDGVRMNSPLLAAMPSSEEH